MDFINLLVAAIIAAAMTWVLALLLSYCVSGVIPMSRSVVVGVVGGLLATIEVLRLWVRLEAKYAALLAEERFYGSMSGP